MTNLTCPICGPAAQKVLVYPRNFNLQRISQKVFSARRQPDRLHYRIVSCSNCGLIYADSVLQFSHIKKLYQQSRFTYQAQIVDLTKTYGYYLKKLESYCPKKNNLLEIGCGNGFFLLEAERQAYQQVWGVEPSRKTVNQAPQSVKSQIKTTMFDKKLFKKNYFDVICFFQTFDHIVNPNRFLQHCRYLLKPGGLILTINHNIDSYQAKILKQRSPIIDIEHPFLYSPKTLKLIFEKNQLQVLTVKPSFNIYSLDYLFFLSPLPKSVKTALIYLITKLKLDQFKLKLKLGNLYLIARKPK